MFIVSIKHILRKNKLPDLLYVNNDYFIEPDSYQVVAFAQASELLFSENDTVIHDGTIWHRVASSSTRTELLNIIGNSSETDIGLMTSEQFNKLKTIASGAEVNVQADWTQNNTSSDSYIKNKPNLKPVATSGKFNDLSDKPTLSATAGKVTLSDTSGWKTECTVPKLNIVALTLSQYNALSSKDPNTVYAITGE